MTTGTAPIPAPARRSDWGLDPTAAIGIGNQLSQAGLTPERAAAMSEMAKANTMMANAATMSAILGELATVRAEQVEMLIASIKASRNRLGLGYVDRAEVIRLIRLHLQPGEKR